MITQLPIFPCLCHISKTTLKNEIAEATNWLKQNNMLVNPKKFHALFMSRKKELITSDMRKTHQNMGWTNVFVPYVQIQ